MSDGVLTRRLEVRNRLGLHARAAAQIVQTLAPFTAEVRLSKDDTTVDARSILGLMTLGAGQGSRVEVSCSGPDAPAALAALERLFARNFDEE